LISICITFYQVISVPLFQNYSTENKCRDQHSLFTRRKEVHRVKGHRCVIITTSVYTVTSDLLWKCCQIFITTQFFWDWKKKEGAWETRETVVWYLSKYIKLKTKHCYVSVGSWAQKTVQRTTQNTHEELLLGSHSIT
jgi:hypothetical protein